MVVDEPHEHSSERTRDQWIAVGSIAAGTGARDAEKAEAVASDLRSEGLMASSLRLDVISDEDRRAAFLAIDHSHGRLDILVNNAAIALQGKTIDDPAIDNAGLDRQWRVNTLGVVANIRAAVKVLPEGGRIISVGSGLGTRVGFPGVADYAASKAAVIGYTRGAARDLGPRNITVNVVQAGVMDTDMAADAVGSLENLPPIVLESHAIQRPAEPKEVAAAIVFLAGSDAAFITGAVLDVNGGFTA